ncbi:hypothetical protein [Pseudomonas helleri]|uniref:Uncharacterized protein n=1 Tax=Pseudomonas helleri TaxID=1608996 RepID=A0A6I1WXD3_9PSED|nr:hypothetical protein [Pseudomonas helleri]MQU46269.1 hypothetical protein [Pseudomonas helleri]
MRPIVKYFQPQIPHHNESPIDTANKKTVPGYQLNGGIRGLLKVYQRKLYA